MVLPYIPLSRRCLMRSAPGALPLGALTTPRTPQYGEPVSENGDRGQFHAHRKRFRRYPYGESRHGGGEPVRGGEAARRGGRPRRCGDRGRDRGGGPRRRLRGEARGNPFPPSLQGTLLPAGSRGRPREEGEIHRGSRAPGRSARPEGGEADEACHRGVRRPRRGRGRGRSRDRRALLRARRRPVGLRVRPVQGGEGAPRRPVSFRRAGCEGVPLRARRRLLGRTGRRGDQLGTCPRRVSSGRAAPRRPRARREGGGPRSLAPRRLERCASASSASRNFPPSRPAGFSPWRKGVRRPRA